MLTAAPARDTASPDAIGAHELAIFLSHPIQHFAPWLRELDRRLGGSLVVHYATRHGLEARHDPELGVALSWDMDLVSGYRHRFWDDGPGRGPGRGFWGIRYPGIDRFLRTHRPRAVLVWGWLFAGYWEAVAAARRESIPYLLRGESNLLNRGGAIKWWLKRQTVGRLCTGASACLAIGRRNAALYEAYGVPRDRIRIVPYFVDNDWFDAERAHHDPRRAAIRAKLGLPADACVFLFIGKLIEKKHPDHLIDAWTRLSAAHRNRSALLIVGAGSMADELKRRAGNDPRVVFAGLLNRGELPEAYAASDVLVLPSDAGETWGLVVNEAMASGRTAIVSDRVGCAPDLVDHERTGLVFPFGDGSALDALLRRAIDEPSLVRRLGAAARAHVETASVGRAADETLAALRAATSGD